MPSDTGAITLLMLAAALGGWVGAEAGLLDGLAVGDGLGVGPLKRWFCALATLYMT